MADGSSDNTVGSYQQWSWVVRAWGEGGSKWREGTHVWSIFVAALEHWFSLCSVPAMNDASRWLYRV
jgi:hypothetical protein